VLPDPGNRVLPMRHDDRRRKLRGQGDPEVAELTGRTEAIAQAEVSGKSVASA
jgi:hypothetical protein